METPVVRSFFGEPPEVISACQVEDVLPALAHVEAAATAGRWAKKSGTLPLLWFGIFDGPLTLDGTDMELGAPGTVGSGDHPSFDLGEWTPDVDPAEYRRAIGAIRQSIADGAVYQVNYTLRLRAAFSGAPLSLHRRLQAAQGPAYSAYLDLGRFYVLSASPELFFERRGSRVTCRPMKGTAPRGR